MLNWITSRFHKHIAQQVPNFLALCEFGWRVGQCSRGEWEKCERRIQLAKHLDVQASGVITQAERPADFSPLAALSLWQRVWPFGALTPALVVNLLWIGALGYALLRLL
jgi:hypothetical protein